MLREQVWAPVKETLNGTTYKASLANCVITTFYGEMAHIWV